MGDPRGCPVHGVPGIVEENVVMYPLIRVDDSNREKLELLAGNDRSCETAVVGDREGHVAIQSEAAEVGKIG